MTNEEIVDSVRKVFAAMQRATDVAPLCSMRESPPEKVAYDRDWHWKACLERALDGDPDPMRETERPITRRWAENALAGIMVGGAAAFLAKQQEGKK